MPRVLGPTYFYLKVWINILNFRMFLGCNKIHQNVVVFFRILENVVVFFRILENVVVFIMILKNVVVFIMTLYLSSSNKNVCCVSGSSDACQMNLWALSMSGVFCT